MNNEKNRRISAPAGPVMQKEDISPYRSLRKEKQKITKKPSVDMIPEAEFETVEERQVGKNTKNLSRPSSTSSENFKKVKIGSTEEVSQKSEAMKKKDEMEKEANINNNYTGYPTQIHVENPHYHHQHNNNHLNHVHSGTYEVSKGHVNLGYSGSARSLNQSTSSSIPSIAVYREQYWSWSCKWFRCSGWTRREKILFTIVAGLMCIICGLVTVVGVLAAKKEDVSLPRHWYTWKL